MSEGHFILRKQYFIYRPSSPRKTNDGSQRTGRRFPAIGTAPSDAIHNKSELDHVPSQGRITIRPKNTPTTRAIRESPLRCYYKAVRKIGICQFIQFLIIPSASIIFTPNPSILLSQLVFSNPQGAAPLIMSSYLQIRLPFES